MPNTLDKDTSFIVRLEIKKENISFGRIATTINNAGGDIVAIDVNHSGKTTTTRDITINVNEKNEIETILGKIKKLNGVTIVHVSDETFLMHLGGKIEVTPKIAIKNRKDLSRVYTPGVARVCMAIFEDPNNAYSLTIKRNTIAVVTDGSAVLGLGNIGPKAAMPVMEGKAMLFKQMGGVNAFPICLDTQDTEEIIRTIKIIAPAFGGINLEDISSPRCFEIEERLIAELDIPVFHDDQHGTAVVILAGLLNAVKVVKKRLENCTVVICGIGAAGIACTKMLLATGVTHIIGVDRDGVVVAGNNYDNPAWNWYAANTNPNRLKGRLSDIIHEADIFIGLSGPKALSVSDIKRMKKDPIVFAMANPTPEITFEEAEPYVRVMATGRSDYPNQINNVLAFPGIFRGVLDCRATQINEQMKLAAANAIASVVSDDELNEMYIIPSVFNQNVVEKVKEAVIKAAYESGVARRKNLEDNQHDE
jgi:malate dehydrogenase (oxaloacetate-decarboxylating)